MWRILVCFLIFGCSYNNPDIGAEYLGMRYVGNPLGEGVIPDLDPTIRFDAFDCTTFVETVIANGDENKLNKIRYKDGVVGFMNRNHFIETDWLKNNSDIIENVSSQYAPTTMRSVTINKKKWLKKNYNIDAKIAEQTVVLEYIPYKYAQSIKTSEPLIVLFINAPGRAPDKIGTDLAVRHMGFLLPNGMLRHASKIQGRVVDVDFHKYVNQMMENQNKLGIMLLRIKK